MTDEQVYNKLEYPGKTTGSEILETHASWVVLTGELVYKIKKPIKYSFLDFSTLEKRKYYCEREIVLNRRLSEDIYLGVQPVREVSGNFFIDGEKGTVVDYAVKMRRMAGSLQMDELLKRNSVTYADIEALAARVAAFHKEAVIIRNKNVMDVRELFRDLEKEMDYLQDCLGGGSGDIIDRALAASDSFMDKHQQLLESRLRDGFFRDCHGDLHSRNIFLLPSPQPFDCLEFNDDYRYIDVLNEVAFLCMDLDAFGRHDLGDRFIENYNRHFAAMSSEEDRQLFIYYKSYRANVRAKVNSLRARSADDSAKASHLAEAEKYLRLMDGYLRVNGE